MRALSTLVRDEWPASPWQMAEVLELLAFDVESAAHAHPILLREWRLRLKKSDQRFTAFLRVVFMLISERHVSVEEMRKWEAQLRNIATDRRKPSRVIREPGQRNTSGLW